MARHVDLAAWCRAQGYDVRPDGRDHWQVRDAAGAGVCRITQRPGERPVWVAWDGATGGDAIALVQYLTPGLPHADALYALAGGVTVAAARAAAPAPRHPPTVPRGTPADREAGRAYLQSRGLDVETIRAAERAGVLAYTRGAVLLIGRDEAGRAQHVIRRGYLPDDPAPKRALTGSDTSYPVMLPGDASRVVVCEGPVTGLAAQALARLRGQAVPTVIVTGGVTLRRWVRQAAPLLRRAARVCIAGERERDPVRQARTDEARLALAREIHVYSHRAPLWLWPAEGCGDLADELQLLAARQAEARAQAAARQAEARAEAEVRQAEARAQAAARQAEARAATQRRPKMGM